MHRAAWLLSLSLVASAQFPPAQQAPVSAPSFEIDFNSVKWTAIPNSTPTAYVATLKVDEGTGATQMLWKFAPNTTSPCHWHTANESNVVVRGSLTMRHMGATGATLGVGGFSFVAKRMNHLLTTGSTEAILFSSLDGRFDYNPVDASECGAPAK
jgi:hypothetical protein